MANCVPQILLERSIIIIIIIISSSSSSSSSIITVSFMQGIYTNIPETNHVPKEHSVAAILSLLFMVPILLLLLFLTAIFFSLGGSSHDTSTDKTNGNKHT
jgi:hypothetical protein